MRASNWRVKSVALIRGAGSLNGHSHRSYVVFRSKRVEQRNLLLDSKAKTVLINQKENIIWISPGNLILIKLENVGQWFTLNGLYLCSQLKIITIRLDWKMFTSYPAIKWFGEKWAVCDCTLTAHDISSNTAFNQAESEDVTKQHFRKILWRKLIPQGSLSLVLILVAERTLRPHGHCGKFQHPHRQWIQRF